MDGWMDGRKDGRKEGRTEGLKDRGTEGQTDGHMGHTRARAHARACTRPHAPRPHASTPPCPHVPAHTRVVSCKCLSCRFNPACLHVCILACLHACMRACVHACMLTCSYDSCVCQLTCLRHYMLARFLLACRGAPARCPAEATKLMRPTNTWQSLCGAKTLICRWLSTSTRHLKGRMEARNAQQGCYVMLYHIILYHII